jgi:hypothetical protein
LFFDSRDEVSHTCANLASKHATFERPGQTKQGRQFLQTQRYQVWHPAAARAVTSEARRPGTRSRPPLLDTSSRCLRCTKARYDHNLRRSRHLAAHVLDAEGHQTFLPTSIYTRDGLTTNSATSTLRIIYVRNIFIYI